MIRSPGWPRGVAVGIITGADESGMVDVVNYSVLPGSDGVTNGNLRGALLRLRSVGVEQPAIVIAAS